MAQPIAIYSAALEFNPPSEIANLDFWEQNVLSNLDDAIAYYQNAFELYPPDHPDRLVCLYNIATSIGFRFQQQNEISDVEMSISLHRMALNLMPSDHHDHPSVLHNLAASLQTKYEHQDEQRVASDVDEAILLGRQALDLRPPGHVYRSLTLNNLAISLQTRFKEQHAVSDIDEAIEFGRAALELRSLDHPCRFASVDNLVTSLLLRYEDTKDVADLNEVIQLQRDTLALCPEGNSYRSKCLSALAGSVRCRFERQGDFTDLDEAISLHREALDHRPIGHPDRSESLYELTSVLELRFERKSTSEDLDESISLHRAAVDLHPRGHRSRPIYLSNLAATLQTRFYHQSTASDLDEAITVYREGMELCPSDYAFRPTLINNLAVGLQSRYQREHTAADLDDAIAFHQAALDLYPADHAYRSSSLFNLALCTRMKYEREKTLTDLDEAIRLYREVLVVRPEDHPDRSQSLDGLAAVLCLRFEQEKTIVDLDEAICLRRTALDLRPRGHHRRFPCLRELAESLLTRFEVRGHTGDLDEAFGLYSELAQTPLSVSHSDVSATRSWASAAEKFKHESGLTAYRSALQYILQYVNSVPPSLELFQRIKQVVSSIPMDSFSYCLRHDAPTTAVELLEQGRMIFWTQFNRLRLQRDDLLALEDAGGTFAKEYKDLSFQLRELFEKPGDLQTPKTHGLMSELDDLISRIRKLPNFDHFLSSPSFSELKGAARDGPVIIVNASSYSCDALVVFATGDPVHVPLKITMEKVSRLASDFKSLTGGVFAPRETPLDTKEKDESNATTDAEEKRAVHLETVLRELRDLVVDPVMCALQRITLPGSRIWWCPTAEFMSLPLHAVTFCMENSTRVADGYIPSYTPSLSALSQTRKRAFHISDEKSLHLAFVSVGDSYQGEYLVVVRQKLEALAARFDSADEKHVFTQLEGEEATVRSVTGVLGSNNWIYLACHHDVNPNQPFESSLVLHDGFLALKKIIQGELAKPCFVFLPASFTSVGDADVPDEAIHISAALYFSRFPSIVATLGVVDDQYAPQIAVAFYDNLLEVSDSAEYPRVAEAWQKTMKTLEDKIPLQQRVCLMHVGI
ncbi:CHAT domain-containing protein [Scleroderma yunnanense]